MQFLAALDVNFKSLALAHVLPQLCVVARQDKLHELVIAKTAAVVQIVKLHHQLHVLDAELRSIGLLQIPIDVKCVDELVTISINSAESCVRLEVVEVRQVLPRLLDAELKVCEVAKEVHQFLLRLPSQHFALIVLLFILSNN